MGEAQDLPESLKPASLLTEELKLHLLRHMAEGVCLVRFSDSVIVYANPQLEQMFGYRPGELQDKSITALYEEGSEHPAQQVVDELRERLRQAGSTTSELQGVKKNGALLWCRARSSVATHPRHGQVWITFHEDITPMKMAEGQFAGIVSTASDAIICVGEAQRITFFNQGAVSLFGYTKEEVLGAPLDILLPERFRTNHPLFMKDFADMGSPARRMGERLPVWALRKGGEEFPCDAAISQMTSGGQHIYTVVLRDITERKQREDEQRFLAEVGGLLGSSLDYETTLENAAQLAVRSLADYCIIDILDEDGRPRCASVAAASKANQGLAQALRSNVDPSHPYLSREALLTGKATLRAQVTEEFLHAHSQDKAQLTLLRLLGPKSLMAVPLVARGRTLGAITLLSTNARRGYTAMDLRVAEELGWRVALAVDNALLFLQAKEATRAREDVLGVVAHDLRNPLNAIKLMAHELMEAQPAQVGPEEEDSPAEIILRSADRMNRLIQDLLEAGQLDAGTLSVELTAVAPLTLLREVVAQMKPLATAHQLQVHLPERLPPIRGDSGRLQQVLLNLLSNALKFTPPGGEISLGAEAQPNCVRFWVADTGPGIPQEHLPHLFNRYWQGDKRDRRGAGLGLAICKGFVEALGGRVWAESQVDKGSTFFFTVPTLLVPLDPPG
ncbi:MAG: PAS domain S-box protein [Myxococcaceae bacterium]|nr:PAS domain S-box protein [Myxococcaceae bacterium]